MQKLLTITNNWQQSEDVDKNMETNATVRKTTGSYKKGNANDWKAKAATGMNPRGTAQGTDKSQKASQAKRGC